MSNFYRYLAGRGSVDVLLFEEYRSVSVSHFLKKISEQKKKMRLFTDCYYGCGPLDVLFVEIVFTDVTNLLL